MLWSSIKSTRKSGQSTSTSLKKTSIRSVVTYLTDTVADIVCVQKLSSLTPFSIIKATGLHQSFDSLCLEPSGAGMCQNDVVPAALKYWFGALLFGFIMFMCKCLCYMCKRCVCVCVCVCACVYLCASNFSCVFVFVCVKLCVLLPSCQPAPASPK